jgi:hypothetical protein
MKSNPKLPCIAPALQSVDAFLATTSTIKKTQQMLADAQLHQPVTEALRQFEESQGKLRQVQELIERQTQPQKDAPEKSAVAELVPLATTLNSESNDLNSTIQTINEKIRALNFGIEVWCKGSDGDYGFARVEDVWQLAARWDGEDPKGDKVEAPLLKRTRDERIEGLSLAEEILKKLKGDAEKKIAAIRRAKQFAASL